MSMKLSLQKLNPDWEKAKKHALANSTGKIKTPNTLSSSRAATN